MNEPLDKASSFDLLVFGQVTKDILHKSGQTLRRTGGVTYACSVVQALGKRSYSLAFVGSENQAEAEFKLQSRGIETASIVIQGGAITYEIFDADELVTQTTLRSGPGIPSLDFEPCIPPCKAALLYPVSLELASKLAALLKSNGSLVAVDLQHDLDDLTKAASLLERSDLVFTNKEAVCSLTGKAAVDEAIDALRTLTDLSWIVVKMGLSGSLIAAPSGSLYQVPAFLSDFQYTVGAGDAYDAAFISALLDGQEHQIAGRFAAQIAAAVVESREENPASAVGGVLHKRTSIGIDFAQPVPVIYVAGHFHSAPLRSYVLWIAAALEKAGFDTYVPHRDGGVVGMDGVTSADAFSADVRALDQCAGVVGLLDGAYRGGTYFELGYAHSRGVPIFVLNTDHTLGISNMVSSSAKLITSDLRQIVSDVLVYCGSIKS